MILLWKARPQSRPGQWLAYLLPIATFAGLASVQLGQPFIIDEAEFPYIAEATSRSGLPIYYHGELRPQDVGIFHPPGYVYALAGWLRLTGDSHAAVRSFGVACAVITALVGAATVRLIVRRWQTAATAAFLTLYLLNPLTIESALLPDIDGTVGVLTIVVGVHVLMRVLLSVRPESWQVPATGAALAAALSTKLTTPLALLPLACAVFLLSDRSRSRAIRDFVLASAIGVAGFLAWWGGLSALTSLDFTYPFDFTLQSLTNKQGRLPLRDRSLWPLARTLFWLDPVLILLGFAACLLAVMRRRSPEARAAGLVAAFGLVTVGMYDLITGVVFTFPKYWIAAVPGLTVAGVWYVTALAERLDHMRWRSRASTTLLGVGLATLLLLASVKFHDATLAGAGLALQPPRSLRTTFGVGIVLTLLIAATVSCAGSTAAKLRTAMTASALLAVFLHGTAQTISLASADYSTRYYFGERGFSAAVSDVQRMTAPHEAILAPKDIGFESGRPFYEDALLFPSPRALEQLLQQRRVTVAVTRRNFDYSAAIFPEAFQVIRAYMEREVVRPRSGFVIWRLRPPGEAPHE